MDDLISRQAAIDAICEHYTDLERRGITGLSIVNHKQVSVDLLESLPAAQPKKVIVAEIKLDGEELQRYIDRAVENIREEETPEIIACADCKHWICHDRRCGVWNHGVKPLDWCSYAERREG